MTKLSFSIQEVSEATGISRSKLYAVFAQGLLTPRKLGGRTLVLRQDLERFLEDLPNGASIPLGSNRSSKRKA